MRRALGGLTLKPASRCRFRRVAVRIGELAKRAGVAPSALRFYEAAGLVPAARRSPAGYRLFEPDLLGRLEFIRRARALGLSLAEIRELVAGRDADSAAENGRLRRTISRKLAEVDQRAADLQALRSQLADMHARLARVPRPECGHLGDCGCWLPVPDDA